MTSPPTPLPANPSDPPRFSARHPLNQGKTAQVLRSRPSSPSQGEGRGEAVSPPSLPRQAANLAAAGVRTLCRAITGQPVLVPPDVETTRLAQCDQCEHQKANRCQCGCPVRGKVRSKVKLAGESCPVGKWLQWPGKDV